MASHRTAMLRQLQSHLTPFPTAAEAEEPTFRELFTKFEHMIPMRDGEPLLPPLPRTHTARPFRFLLFPALAALPILPSRPTPPAPSSHPSPSLPTSAGAGVKLHTTVYVPKLGPDGMPPPPMPMLMQRSPYSAAPYGEPLLGSG